MTRIVEEETPSRSATSAAWSTRRGRQVGRQQPRPPGPACPRRPPATDRNGRRPSVPATFQESSRVPHVTSDILGQVPIDAIPERMLAFSALSPKGVIVARKTEFSCNHPRCRIGGCIVRPASLPLLRRSLVLGVRATGAVDYRTEIQELTTRPTGSPRTPIPRPAADPACLRVRTLPIAIPDLIPAAPIQNYNFA